VRVVVGIGIPVIISIILYMILATDVLPSDNTQYMIIRMVLSTLLMFFVLLTLVIILAVVSPRKR